MIPVFRPSYDEREEQAVQDVLRSGWVGQGPKVDEFEVRFARAVGAKHAVAVNSCTAALHLALYQLDVGPGDEVIVPSITFVSTAAVIEQLGARPVFCDVDQRTLLLDWDDVRQKRTYRTKAVMAVLYAGQPVEVPNDVGVPVVYDCAHACGTAFDASGKTCCWSFHAVKNLATGDGGMLTTDDADFCERAKRLRWLGIDRTTWDRTKLDRRYWWQYRVEETGFKCHMNDIAAAIGLVQLQKLPVMQARRLQIAQQYCRRLCGLVDLPRSDESTSWHLFVIRTPQRDELSEFLREAGVHTSVHYRPLHLSGRYTGTQSLPVAERVWTQILTLPLFPDMNTQQVDFVCDRIQECLSETPSFRNNPHPVPAAR